MRRSVYGVRVHASAGASACRPTPYSRLAQTAVLRERRREFSSSALTGQFGGQIWNLAELALGIAVFDYKVSALHIAKFTQSFEERIV